MPWRGAPAWRLWPRGAGGLAIDAEGVLTLPDGDLRAVLRVGSTTLEARTPAEQDELAAQFAALVTSLAPGQRLQILVESRPLDGDAVLARLQAGLRPAAPALAAFAALWQPWLARQVRRRHVPDLRFFVVVAPPPPRRVRSPEATLRALEQAVDEVSRHLARMQLDVMRLGRPEALELLWSAFHPGGTPLPAGLRALPLADQRNHADTDSATKPTSHAGDAVRALAPHVARLLWPRGRRAAASTSALALWRGLCNVTAREGLESLCVDGVWLHSLSLLFPPEYTDPGWLDALVSLDRPFRLAWHLEGLDRHAERARLKRKRRLAHNVTVGALGAGGLSDVDMEGAQWEAAQQLADLRHPQSRIVRMGLYLTLLAPERRALAAATERALSALQTELEAESARGLGHQLPLWQSTLPLGLDAARRVLRTRSEVIGNGVPFLTHTPGMSAGFPLGFTAEGHELVLFDPAERSLPNALMCILGRSGSGKTFLAQKLALLTLLGGGRVTVIDPADHYETLRRVVGGTVVRLGAPDTPILNIWDLAAGDGTARGPAEASGTGTTEAGAGDLAATVRFVVAAHEILLSSPGQALDPLTRAVIEQGVRAIYAAHDMAAANDAQHSVAAPEASTAESAHDTSTPTNSVPLERDLVDWLEASAPGQPPEQAALYRTLAASLRPYVRDGCYAHLVDRPTSVDLETPLLIFSLEGLTPTLHALAIFAVSEAVNRRAQRRPHPRTETPRMDAQTPELPAGAPGLQGEAPGRTGDTPRVPAGTPGMRELLIIDEGWYLVKYAAGGAWIETIARRGRHWGLFLCFITQQLSDLLKDPRAASLFNAASATFIFRLKDEGGSEIEGESGTVARLARTLRLSAAEVAAIQRLSGVPRQYAEMFLCRDATDSSSTRRGVVQVLASPWEYWLFTSEPTRDRPAREEMIARHGGDAWAAIAALASGESGENAQRDNARRDNARLDDARLDDARPNEDGTGPHAAGTRDRGRGDDLEPAVLAAR